MSEIRTKTDAREAILKGITKVMDAIIPTLGGGSKGVLIEQKGYPLIVNDGVTVVNAIDSDDRFERMGIRLMQQVANRTQSASGDGTTTATVLAGELCKTFFENDLNWVEWSLALDHVLSESEKILEGGRDGTQQTRIIAQTYNLEDVALTATRDLTLAKMVSEIVEETGKDGNVSFKPSLGGKTYWNTVDGFRMDSGLMNPLFANKDGGKYEKTNPVIVFASYTIQDFEDITPALEIAVGEGRPILFLVAGMKGTALSNLLVNKAAGVVDACVVKCGGQGQDMLNWMADIQAITGGKTFTIPEEMRSIAKGQDHFGSCSKVEATEDCVVFSGEDWDLDGEINEYIDTLRLGSMNTESEWEKEKYNNRISRLSNGVVTVFVGGHSDIEITDKREKIHDAINACGHALDGCVLGGGIALWSLSTSATPHNQSGAKIANAMQQIRRHICYNMGYTEGQITMNNPVHVDIYDPIQVVLNSLRSAVSIAQQFARIEVAVLVEDSE